MNPPALRRGSRAGSASPAGLMAFWPTTRWRTRLSCPRPALWPWRRPAGEAGKFANIQFDRFLPLWSSGDQTPLQIARGRNGRWSCATGAGRHAQCKLFGLDPEGNAALQADLAACIESCQVKGQVERLYGAYNRPQRPAPGAHVSKCAGDHLRRRPSARRRARPPAGAGRVCAAHGHTRRVLPGAGVPERLR